MRLGNTAVKPATISTARNNKVGWYENHERQVKLINKLQQSTLVIGNFTATGLLFQISKTVNCGIPGDKTQRVLWRAEDLLIQPAVKFAVIHCRTNNLDYDDSNIIAKEISCIAKQWLK